MRSWKNIDLGIISENLTCHWMQRHESVYIVSEHLNSNWMLFVNRINLDSVSAHSECATSESYVVSVVLNVHQSAK